MFHKILCIHGPCGSPVRRTLVLFFLVIPPLPLSLKSGLYHGLPDSYTLSSSDSFFLWAIDKQSIVFVTCFPCLYVYTE